MNSAIRLCEFLSGRFQALAVGLRCWRGSPADAHFLSHIAVAQMALDEKRCNGDRCVAETITEAFEQRERAN